MTNAKKVLTEGIKIQQSPAIKEFIEWYDTNTILSEDEDIDSAIIEESTIKPIISFFKSSKHFAHIKSATDLLEQFGKVLNAVDSDAYDSFAKITEFEETEDASADDIEDVKSALEQMEDSDEAEVVYAAFQDLSDHDVLESIQKIAVIVASEELHDLIVKMRAIPSNIKSYLDGAEDENMADSYDESYDRMGFADDNDTLSAVLGVAQIVSHSSITVEKTMEEILKNSSLFDDLFDHDGDTNFTEDQVDSIIAEFSNVGDGDSVLESSIVSGLAKLDEHINKSKKK
jgi:uncharacterized membrane protein YdfJ with MMPL/SSD domain